MSPLVALCVPIIYMLVMEGVLLLRRRIERKDWER